MVDCTDIYCAKKAREDRNVDPKVANNVYTYITSLLEKYKEEDDDER